MKMYTGEEIEKLGKTPPLVSLSATKKLLSLRVTNDTRLVFTKLIESLQPDNCSEITSLDVPFSKKRLDVAVKQLKKLHLIRDTTKEHFYMLNPLEVLYSYDKRIEYCLKFAQSSIETTRMTGCSKV